ncbi:LEA type 2 family protein [Halegenticoccus soli]|uniref:LEA type 2 family protein n=1 Tax=Halegenticoccus soli TaxID=1985678 RepID=UPI000C6DFBDD|nr:LEA type 2 family protein [Halegenticoccus soli]
MDRNPVTTTLVAALIVVLAVASAAVIGVATLERPRIDGVDNSWGTVAENRTEIETQIAVDNPRLLEWGDGVADVTYTVSLNSVQIADGRKKQVDLSGGRDVITASTWMNNDDVPEWWVTHVNNDETTTVRVNPAVVVESTDVTFPVDSRTRTRTVETDLLAPLQTNETRRFGAFGRTLLVVNGTDARWGHATAERTPLIVSATVTNPTPVPIPIADIGYTIRMNGVRVGHSVGDQEEVIPPHSTRTIETRAIIDNSKLDEWWVTHLRNDETTRLTVDFHATVEYRGERQRLPLDFLTYQRTFDTNIFQQNAVSVNGSVDTDGTPAQEPTPRTRTASR